MEEENDDEKPLVGVKLVCTTDFHHDRCILCQRYDKKFETRRIPFNPVGNGWYIENEKLFPSKGLKEFPADLLVLCGCKGRCRGRLFVNCYFLSALEWVRNYDWFKMNDICIINK